MEKVEDKNPKLKWQWNETPLHYAAQYNHLEIAEITLLYLCDFPWFGHLAPHGQNCLGMSPKISCRVDPLGSMYN